MQNEGEEEKDEEGGGEGEDGRGGGGRSVGRSVGGGIEKRGLGNWLVARVTRRGGSWCASKGLERSLLDATDRSEEIGEVGLIYKIVVGVEKVVGSLLPLRRRPVDAATMPAAAAAAAAAATLSNIAFA